jgi:hypothetical protein
MAMHDENQRRRHLYRLKTNAVVLHCPGPLRSPENTMHVEWIEAQESFFNDLTIRHSFSDEPDLKIVTYNTSQNRSLLERCMDHLGLRLTVLGHDLEDWRWEYKITLVRDYLKSSTPTNYIMCLDAFDTLVLASPREILARFRKASIGILFGGTGSDWPASAVHRRFEVKVADDASPAHRHLNASYIGRTSDVNACLDRIEQAIRRPEPWCFTESGFDDQLAWREMHRLYYPRLQIDKNCLIFARFDEDR